MRAFRGTTLLMSTEELLAVLHDWPDAATAPSEPPAAPPEPADPIREPRVVRATVPPPAPTREPSVLRRWKCGRRGHDPRPHRAQPHDEVVYRCLRCGMPMPAPERPAR
jgi:hypothetical protein